MRAISWRCWFTGWILAWAVSVYLSSFVLAVLGLSPTVAVTSAAQLFSATFHVADDVSPWAKLAPGLLMALGFAGIASRRFGFPVEMLLATAVSLASCLFTLAILPAGLSRGFGVGLTGQRFETAPTIVYLLSAALAGLLFAIVHRRCLSAGKRRSQT